jgi:hypothetical protein
MGWTAPILHRLPPSACILLGSLKYKDVDGQVSRAVVATEYVSARGDRGKGYRRFLFTAGSGSDSESAKNIPSMSSHISMLYAVCDMEELWCMSTSESIKSDTLTSPEDPSSPCTISPRSQVDRCSVPRSFRVLCTTRVPLQSISVGLINSVPRDGPDSTGST